MLQLQTEDVFVLSVRVHLSLFKMSQVQLMHRCFEIESTILLNLSHSISLTVQWDLSSAFGPTTIASLKVKILQEHTCLKFMVCEMEA